MGSNLVMLDPGYDQHFQAREQALIEALANHDELVVAFSGRPESCYGMDLCRASGIRIRAITLDHPLLSRSSIARASRYCRHHEIEHRVLRTDELIFSDELDRLSHLAEVPDPARYLGERIAQETDWGHLPMLLAASVEERREYLRRFDAPPANFLWIFAEQGMMQRDLRYGFHKRKLTRWGQAGRGCLSRRIVDPASLAPRQLRMVDMAEQMLADMGLDEAQIYCHTLADRTILARVRVPQRLHARVFDRQEDILKALQSAEFDLMTLDLVPGEDVQALRS